MFFFVVCTSPESAYEALDAAYRTWCTALVSAACPPRMPLLLVCTRGAEEDESGCGKEDDEATGCRTGEDDERAFETGESEEAPKKACVEQRRPFGRM